MWETSSLIENFVKRYIFKNLNPELVDTKEPPIITKIKYIKLLLFVLNENPKEASISILVSKPKEEPNPITFWHHYIIALQPFLFLKLKV